MKNHFFSAPSFCVVTEKAKSVPTVPSLPLHAQYRIWIGPVRQIPDPAKMAVSEPIPI